MPESLRAAGVVKADLEMPLDSPAVNALRYPSAGNIPSATPDEVRERYLDTSDGPAD
jgi:hypothetical protein